MLLKVGGVALFVFYIQHESRAGKYAGTLDTTDFDSFLNSIDKQ